MAKMFHQEDMLCTALHHRATRWRHFLLHVSSTPSYILRPQVQMIAEAWMLPEQFLITERSLHCVLSAELVGYVSSVENAGVRITHAQFLSNYT